MSKLIDKLEQVRRPASQPMGFARSQASGPKNKMVLVASLSRPVDNLPDYVAGADTALWRPAAHPKLKDLLEKSSAVKDLPWGYWPDSATGQEMEAITRSDLDFVIFPAAAPLSKFEDKLGLILHVEASLAEGLIRSLNALPIDAIVVAEPVEEHLTWGHLLLYQRFAGMVNKPLLVTSPPAITGDELQALLDAGVDGIIVDATAAKLSGIRQQIDGLKPRRKREHAEALIPRVAPEAEPAEVEEEEE